MRLIYFLLSIFIALASPVASAVDPDGGAHPPEVLDPLGGIAGDIVEDLIDCSLNLIDWATQPGDALANCLNG